MRTRRWSISLLLAGLAVGCGDQMTEVVPERDAAPGALQVPGAIALATSSTEDGLSITTDKDDYQPGDTVHFTGAGWPANDTLDILLEDEPATHDPHTWWIPVGEDGTFRDSTYIVDVGDLGVTFTLTATSRATGRSLAVTFTDGNLNSVALNPSSRSVAQTGQVDYSIDVDMTGNSNPCTVTLSVLASPALPSGAVATILGGNPISATNADFSRTLRITTTSVTPGSYPFTVQAARGSNCQGSGNVTVGGTLIVFGPATHLAFGQQPSDATAGATITPAVTVRVLDANNNLVANSSASVSLGIQNNPGGGTLTGGAAVNAVDGIATFGGLSINKVGIGYTLAASSLGLTGATSSAFDITVGAAAQVAFVTQPSGAAPNTAFTTQPVVQVQDANGNRKTTGAGSGVAITLSIVSGTGTAGAVLTCPAPGTNPVSASAGQSAFTNCRIDLAGTGYKLLATTGNIGGGVGVLTVESAAFDVVANNQPPTVNAGGPYTVAEGTELSLTPTVTDPDAGDVLSYQWTIDYTTPIDLGGSCSFDDATAKNAKITCDDDSNGGTFTLTLEVKDGAGGHTVTNDADLTVTNANPTANAGGSYSGNEGSDITLNGSGDDPGDNDDGALTYKWSIAYTTPIDAGGMCSFDDDTKKDAKVNCDDDSNGGTFTLSLVVKDDDNGTSSASTASLTVNNVKPTISSLTKSNDDPLPAGIAINGTLPIKTTFSDPGTNDTHTAQIDCGSGTYADVNGGADVTSPVTPSCTFTTIGTKTVRVKVRDDDGGYDVKSHTIQVTYVFSGFFAPVDRPNTMNVSKAGQAIPLKWRLTDANGLGVTNLTELTVKATNMNCSLAGTSDNLEEYAAGSSGLQNLGDGYYQFNWKTPANYVNSCKQIQLVFGSDPNTYTEMPSAYFSFKK